MDSLLSYLYIVFLPQVFDGLVVGMAIVLVALGLTLIFGLLGVLNLAHGELYIAGGYAAVALTAAGLPFWIAILIAPFAAVIIGLAIQQFGLRSLQGRPHYALLTLLLTFGISLILREAAQAIAGPDPLRLVPPVTGVFVVGEIFLPRYRVVVFAISAALVAALWWGLHRTILGAMLRAAAYDREMTASLGIPTRPVFIGTFALGSFLAGLAGVLLSPIYSISPESGHGFILLAFATIIIGGMGSVVGAVVAGLAVGQLFSVGSLWIPPVWAETLIFVAMLLVLILRPRGLFGQFGRA